MVMFYFFTKWYKLVENWFQVTIFWRSEFSLRFSEDLEIELTELPENET